MKKWIISQSEEINGYLLANKKSIWLTKVSSDEDIDTLIEKQKLINVKIIRYSELKEFIFIDTDTVLQVIFKDDEEDEIVIPLDITTYEMIKDFFISNLNEINVKEYSVFKQVKPSGVGALISVAITTLLYTTAISLTNGESVSTSGRRGLIKKLLVAIADFLGPTGSLLVGGLITMFFIYVLINTLRNPKKGQLVKVNAFTEMKF